MFDIMLGGYLLSFMFDKDCYIYDIIRFWRIFCLIFWNIKIIKIMLIVKYCVYNYVLLYIFLNIVIWF